VAVRKGRVRLGGGVVGVDEEARVVFVLKTVSRKVVESLARRGYRVIVLDSEFTPG
jgi:hypothetical protein